MLNKVYAVVENMPGYMPEGDPVWFESKSEAEAYAKEREDENGDDSAYVVDVIPQTSDHSAEVLNQQVFGFTHGGIFPKYQEGVAVAENVGPGVQATIGEEGPEAVIPLDDPDAVETMAEAIAEGTGEGDGEKGIEAAGEAVEAAAEAVEEAAETVEETAEVVEAVSDNVTDILEKLADFAEEVSEDAAEMEASSADAVEAAAEAVEETAQETAPSPEPRRDTPPRSTHWAQRPLRRKD